MVHFRSQLPGEGWGQGDDSGWDKYRDRLQQERWGYPGLQEWPGPLHQGDRQQEHLYPNPPSPEYKPFVSSLPVQQATLGASDASLYWQDSQQQGPSLGTASSGRGSRAISSATEDRQELRMGKDQRMAREAGIGLDVKQDIVTLPMDEFNDLLNKQEMSEDQLNLCRDIRRRGKNKVAAQNCRKRKIDQIDELQVRLAEAMHIRSRLQVDQARLLAEQTAEEQRLSRLTEEVLRHEGKSPGLYMLQVARDGEVSILPKCLAGGRQGQHCASNSF